MNTSTFLRLITRSSCSIYSKHNHVPRTIKQLGCSRMSTKASQIQNKIEKDSFLDVLPSITDSIIAKSNLSTSPELGAWLRQILEYNLAGGKLVRGLSTCFAYEMLEKPENITDETIYSAKVLGWCVEMLQAYLLILDDIMDGSTTRRGVPCWYRLPNVGLRAVNDSMLLYSAIHHTIKSHFSDHKYYSQILDVMNDTLMNTAIGQNLDISMSKRNKNDYSLFTIDQYNAIIKYKTAYYTYKLPVSLGLLLANKADSVTHQKVEDICIEMGKFFQMQDDYIDCYSDESVSGKMGTDIQEGKCTWLAVKALERCTGPQKLVFTTCYGSQEPAHIERIKVLYQQLQIKELYAEEEKKIYESLIKQAHSMPDDLSPTLFVKLINMIYKRLQ